MSVPAESPSEAPTLRDLSALAWSLDLEEDADDPAPRAPLAGEDGGRKT